MVRFLLAFAVSLAVHALAALALVAWFEYGPGPETLATLDLSSVELSFAETVDETAAVAPTLPAEANPAPPKPKAVEMPPRPEEPPKALPPDPSSMRFVEPKETHPEMRTPERKEPEKAPETPQSATPASPAAAPRQARVEAPPKPRKTIRPEYPKGARQRGEQGDVTLEIRVNAEGGVDEVFVVRSSGFPDLDEAARKAAASARFVAAKSGGRPVSSVARLNLTFRLR